MTWTKAYVIIFRNAYNLMITKKSQDTNILLHTIITTFFLKSNSKDITVIEFNSRNNIYLYRLFPPDF